MKRTYTITISPARVALDLCWRWRVGCISVSGDDTRGDDLGSGLSNNIANAGTAAIVVTAHAEAAYVDGEDRT